MERRAWNAVHQNFHRAADALFITQPALTKSIRNIENLLNVPLFDRLPNCVSPTPYCEVILEHASDIFITLEEITNKLQATSNIQRGSLRVGSGPHTALTILPEALIKLIEQHHDIGIHILIETWSTLATKLRKGDIHLFISDVESLSDQSDLDILPLPKMEGILVCRAGHPLSDAGKATPEDLLKYPLATPSMPKRFSSWLINSTPKGIKPENYCERVLRFSTDNHALLCNIVQNSNYLTAGTEKIYTKELKQGVLVKLKLEGFQKLSSYQPGIVSLKNRTLPPAGKVFIDYIKDYYQK